MFFLSLSVLRCILPRDVRTLTFCQLYDKFSIKPPKVKLLAGEQKETECFQPCTQAVRLIELKVASDISHCNFYVSVRDQRTTKFSVVAVVFHHFRGSTAHQGTRQGNLVVWTVPWTGGVCFFSFFLVFSFDKVGGVQKQVPK